MLYYNTGSWGYVLGRSTISDAKFDYFVNVTVRLFHCEGIVLLSLISNLWYTLSPNIPYKYLFLQQPFHWY